MDFISPGPMYAEHVRAAADELIARLVQRDEATFTHRPGPDEWSAAEVVGHMREMLPYWAGVAAAVAAAPGTRFGRALDDPARLAAVANANAIPRADALHGLRDAAHQSAMTIAALDDDAWAREGVHPQRGPQSVEIIIRTLVVEHAEMHLRQALDAAGA